MAERFTFDGIHCFTRFKVLRCRQVGNSHRGRTLITKRTGLAGMHNGTGRRRICEANLVACIHSPWSSSLDSEVALDFPHCVT